MSRTLVSFIHGIGDNIMLTGVLAAYAARHPDETLELLLLNSACGTVWRGNPHVHGVHLYPHPQPRFWNPAAYRLHDLWVLRRYLRDFRVQHGFDRVIHSEIQTLPEILYHVTGTYGGHKVQRLAKEFGLPATTDYPYELHSSPDETRQAADWLAAKPARPLFALHPFSGHALKSMPVAWLERLHHQTSAAGFQPAIIGSLGDAARIPAPLQTDAVIGWSFGALLALMRHAAGFAGVDSSIAHLAAAAEVPRLIITSPKLRPDRYVPLTRGSACEVVSTREGWTDEAWHHLNARMDIADNPDPPTATTTSSDP